MVTVKYSTCTQAWLLYGLRKIETSTRCCKPAEIFVPKIKLYTAVDAIRRMYSTALLIEKKHQICVGTVLTHMDKQMG